MLLSEADAALGRLAGSGRRTPPASSRSPGRCSRRPRSARSARRHE